MLVHASKDPGAPRPVEQHTHRFMAVTFRPSGIASRRGALFSGPGRFHATMALRTMGATPTETGRRQALLRALPSIDELLLHVQVAPLVASSARSLVVEACWKRGASRA